MVCVKAEKEYTEGHEAHENFKQLARAVFQAPRVENPKKQPKKTTRRKASGSRKG
jgi:hypothetical protein